MRERLLQIQRDNNWSDRQMAERLGITRSRWAQIRKMGEALSGEVKIAAAKAWPELAPLLTAE